MLVPSVRTAFAIVVAIAAAGDDLDRGILAAQGLTEFANHLAVSFGSHAPRLIVNFP